MKIKLTQFHTYCREQLGLGEHSLRAYQQDLKAFQTYLKTQKNALEMNSELLIAYHQHLREVIGSSPATIRRRFITLRSYFKWLEGEAPNTINPFIGFHIKVKVPERLPRPVDRSTLKTLFKSTKHLITMSPETGFISKRDTSSQITGLVARLLIVTGMRIGEITHLRICDVTGACTQIRVRGKGKRERAVYVTNQQLIQDFSHYWRIRMQQAEPNAFLFINSRGNRLTEAAFRKRLRTISHDLFINPYLTPHRFRHSAATMLIEEGVDIRIVQRLLGHGSISTTEIYTKVSDNSLMAAIERADTLSHVDS